MTARITEAIGDIFEAPENGVLIRTSSFEAFEIDGFSHIGVDACNCKGSWNAGVALKFKERVRTVAHRDHPQMTFASGEWELTL